MNRILTLILAGIFFLPARPVRALNADSARLDQLFDLLEDHQQMMGSVTVAIHGKPVYNRQLGFRAGNGYSQTASSPGTKFRVGSISKMFTATIVLQLAEEGKLDLQTPLSEFYPQLPHASQITIEHMLCHHSGLPHFHFNGELEQLWNARDEAEVLRIAASQPFVPADVKNGAYSNLNYILLGFILEKITHENYESLVQERITDKLGLHDTYYLQEKCDAGRDEAHSFNFRNGVWEEVEERAWSFTEASGLLVSTTDDLTHFITSLFNGELIGKASLAKMTTLRNEFGFGIGETPFYEQEGFGHTGRIEGFLSTLVYFPGSDLSVALTINGQVYPMNDILIDVLSILYGEEYQLPSFDEVSLKKEQIAAVTGRYYAPDLGVYVTISEQDGTLLVTDENGLLGKQTALKPLSSGQFLQQEQGAVLSFEQEDEGEAKRGLLTICGASIALERKE